MTPNVFVLASPSPVLFVYPSALHEGPDEGFGGGRFANNVYQQLRARQREEDDLLVLALL